MYPGPELLQEVGRVTIAGSRLDLQMGMLWHHLDRTLDPEWCRRRSAGRQREEVEELASQRLTGDMQQRVLAALDAAAAASDKRNDVLHQDWILRGLDSMRSVTELANVDADDLSEYLEEWERESKASPNWQRVPSRSLDLLPAQTLEELGDVERELRGVTDEVTALTFLVASSRDTGRPPG
jgi:hypothetical protein